MNWTMLKEGWKWEPGRGCGSVQRKRRGKSNQRKWEMRTVPKQGCVEQMLGAGADICLIKRCLAWMLKWRARGIWEESEVWVADKDVRSFRLKKWRRSWDCLWRMVGMVVSRWPSCVREGREGSVWCLMSCVFAIFFQELRCIGKKKTCSLALLHSVQKNL